MNTTKKEAEIGPEDEIPMMNPWSDTGFSIFDTVRVVKLDPAARVPSKAHTTDAGYDVFSLEKIRLEPHSVTKVRTGISLGIPDGYWVQVEGRGSLGVEGIFPVAGIVDQEYRGEIIICLANIRNIPFEFPQGAKIAQLVLRENILLDFVEADSHPDETERGEKGFGSSGS